MRLYTHHLTFAQPSPPLGIREALNLLRNKARHIDLYRAPASEEGAETLGQMLFGCPGFQGLLRAETGGETIELFIYTRRTEAAALIQVAADRAGLEGK